ncbi:MAG: hypothetical protein GQE15_23405 [Archangiaceae bacterium]|nr:hypothetical protein [Archangiaceae bacterium]
MKTRTVVIVLAVVGVMGLCLVGSCLSLGLLAAASEDSNAPANEVTPAGADDEVPNSGTRYQCMATGSVNKCVGPGRCTFMTVSGVGSGEDRFQASEMARIACQGQAIAMGGSTVCMVACTPK